MNGVLERNFKEAVLAYFKLFPGILLEGLGETEKKVRVRTAATHSIFGVHSENKAMMLLLY
jgi:hypothetical protein